MNFGNSNNLKSSLSLERNFMSVLQSDVSGFTRLSKILKDNAGIYLVSNEKNLALMAARLFSVLKERGFTSYKEYIRFLEADLSDRLPDFISAMTTNTTQFFREPSHFDFFKKKLLEVIEQKKRGHHYELRLWCAASSTGQEVYSLLMVLLDQMINLNHWNIKFLATDIDLDVLKRAARGVYHSNEVCDVPSEQFKRYFTHSRSSSFEDEYQIKHELRDLVRFSQFNLLSPTYPFQYPFDFIFCRNVLIYFDKTTVESVLAKLVKAMRVGGYLFLGHSESGMMRLKNVQTVSNAVYLKTGSSI